MEIITEQSTDTSTHEIRPSVDSKLPKIPKRKLILGAIVVLVSFVIVLALVLINLNDKRSEMVKKELQNIQSVLEQRYSKDGAYPATVNNLVPSYSKSIHVSGLVSSDGSGYCVSAYDENNRPKVFHIINDRDGVIDGNCDDINVQKLPKIGGLNVQFVTKNSINASWQKVAGADSYSLQCSVDKTYRNVGVNIISSEPNATCSKLKSKTEYYIRVKASNSKTDSQWSDLIKIRTY